MTKNTLLELTRPVFKQILELSVMNSFFLFNGALYKQGEGVGEGLPKKIVSFREIIWLSECPLKLQAYN